MANKSTSPAALAAVAHGMASLEEMAQLSGVPRRTLADWFKERPVLFEVAAVGCKAKKGAGK